jgi:homeobox protein HoxA/B2
VKKEAGTTSTKSSFYNSYDGYRKDNVASPLAAGSAINTIVVGAQNVSPYGRNSHQNSHNSMKNKFQNINIQEEGYFPGYYPPGNKQQSEVFLSKHDAEYAQHQKAILAQHHIAAFNQKQEFAAAHHRNEFHGAVGSKADFHQKLHEFHGKAHEFQHSGNQMYYNHENNPNNVQYGAGGGGGSGQYYHNEYDPSAEGGAVGYYDAKTQSHYYENVNYHQGDYHHNESAYIPPAGGEHCENFGFTAQQQQQYYEAQQQNQINHNVHNLNNHQLASSPHNSHNHIIAAAPPPPNHNAVMATAGTVNTGNFIHHGQQPQVFTNPAASVIAGSAHLENSNSSSDFNFLSNLANDFAPEYYQLS